MPLLPAQGPATPCAAPFPCAPNSSFASPDVYKRQDYTTATPSLNDYFPKIKFISNNLSTNLTMFSKMIVSFLFLLGELLLKADNTILLISFNILSANV